MYLFVEIHPLLTIANVYILDSGGNNFNIGLRSNEIYIVQDNNNELVRCFKLKNIEFQPNTCSNLHQLANGGLSFRIQIKLITTSIESNKALAFIQPLTSYNAKCVFCDSILIYENSVFDRVLPLPSDEALNDYSSWFCCRHSHSHSDSSSASLKVLLHPKEKDLFYSDHAVIVNSKVIDLCAVKVKDNNQVYCKRCDSLLGETKPDNPDDLPAFRLLKHAVIFNSMSNNNEFKGEICKKSITHYKKEFVSILLNFQKNMINKFVITGEIDKKFTILIWLSNTGILKFSTCFKMKTETQREVELPCDSNIKVLYLIEDASSQIYKEWQNDPTVEIISVSDEFQLQIVNILVKSTKELPNPLKKLDNYWISYL